MAVRFSKKMFVTPWSKCESSMFTKENRPFLCSTAPDMLERLVENFRQCRACQDLQGDCLVSDPGQILCRVYVFSQHSL